MVLAGATALTAAFTTLTAALAALTTLATGAGTLRTGLAGTMRTRMWSGRTGARNRMMLGSGRSRRSRSRGLGRGRTRPRSRGRRRMMLAGTRRGRGSARTRSIGRAVRAGAALTVAALATVAALLREGGLEFASHRGLNRGGGGLDELPHILQLLQRGLAVDAEFLGNFINAWFRHYLFSYP